MLVTDLVRTGLHRVLKNVDLAQRMNAMLGEPICSKEELLRRRDARARLKELRASGAKRTPMKREQAPVQVYHEGDRNARLLGRVKELLDSKTVKYTLLDVAGDPATKEFVMLQSKCKEDELPIVFVGGVAVGGYNELVDWDVSGRLAKALTGA
jgi:glutaredoxin